MLTHVKLAAVVQAAVLVPLLSLPSTASGAPAVSAASAAASSGAAGGPPTTTTSTEGRARYFPPVPGAVAQEFDPPQRAWDPGHRGVDLWSAHGALVVAPGAGVVTFAGSVAGKPVVVVTHPDGLRSSLEPVAGTVPQGTAVRAGDPVGVLAASPGDAANPDHCVALTPPAGSDACVHWGVRRGATYLDPLTLIGFAPPIVLLPPTR